MNCRSSRDVYVKIFLRRMIALPLADSLRVACCWRIRESVLFLLAFLRLEEKIHFMYDISGHGTADVFF